MIVNMEVSIVATSLVSISNDLGGFDRIGWVVTSYLTTYTSKCKSIYLRDRTDGLRLGLIIIWSKFSNSFGRKTCIITALFIFTAFSGACGGSQTMNQLYDWNIEKRA
jgi:MFS family permease